MASGHEPGPTCSEMQALISEYLDGELETRSYAELEQHLRNCSECESLVESVKQTVRLSRICGQTRAPDRLRRRLTRALEIAGAIRDRPPAA